MRARERPSAPELIDLTRAQLRPLEEAILTHRYVRAVKGGTAPTDVLRAFAAEEHLIIANDRRTLARLAARFPMSPFGEFFLDAAVGGGHYLEILAGFEAVVGLRDGDLATWEPDPSCQACTAFMSWLALDGSPLDVGLAFAVWLPSWCIVCGAIADGLRTHYRMDAAATAFFDYFVPPPLAFQERLLVVIESGLEQGNDTTTAQRAARFLQEYEVLFWNGLAQHLGGTD